MILALLAAALVAWWKWGRGMRRGQLLAAAAAIGGLALLARRELWLGVPLLTPALWMLFRAQLRQMMNPTRTTRSAAIGIDEAYSILGLSAGADAEAIRAAHRRLVARVHPDQGGSADLAGRVNAARDILLARASKRTSPGDRSVP